MGNANGKKMDRKKKKIALLTLGLQILEKEKEEDKSKKKIWVRGWLQTGSIGYQSTLVYRDILKDGDEMEFAKSFRMEKKTFDAILVCH